MLIMKINELANRYFQNSDLSTKEFQELYDECICYLGNVARRQGSFYLLADEIDEIIFKSIEDALVVKSGRKHFSPARGSKFENYLRVVFIHDFIDGFHRVMKRRIYRRRVVLPDENGRDRFFNFYYEKSEPAVISA
jgi:hypothetical protein